ncbi:MULTISPECIES: hypothetical protein [Cupriavidus]
MIDPVRHRRLNVETATRGESLQTLTEMALMVGLSGLAHTFRYRGHTGSIAASPVDGCSKLLVTADLVNQYDSPGAKRAGPPRGIKRGLA